MLELNPRVPSTKADDCSTQHMVCCIELAPALRNQNAPAKKTLSPPLQESQVPSNKSMWGLMESERACKKRLFPRLCRILWFPATSHCGLTESKHACNKDPFHALAGLPGSQQQVTAGAPAGDRDLHHALPGCHQRQLPPGFLDIRVVLLRKVQGGAAGLPQALVGAPGRRAVPPAVLLRLLEPASQRSQAQPSVLTVTFFYHRLSVVLSWHCNTTTCARLLKLSETRGNKLKLELNAAIVYLLEVEAGSASVYQVFVQSSTYMSSKAATWL